MATITIDERLQTRVTKIPALENVRVEDPHLRSFLESMKEIIEIRENRRGHADDRFISYRELVELLNTDETAVSSIDHGTMAGLSDDDHTLYLLASGGRALTANWDAGSFKITAETFESDVATGTAPFTVASTTVVTNLNADYLDGQHGSYYAVDSEVLKKDGSVALTANWDAGGYEIRAETFESDVATGTAPLTIASTTLVTNLNADLLDGQHASYFSAVTNVVLRDGSQALTADWDAGSFKITAQQFESDIATGTAPFIVASTTVVTNLNADKLDGYDAADIDYSFVSGNDAATDVTGAELETLSDGSNADALHVHTMASGISDESNYLLAAGSRALTANWDAGSFKITAQQFESDIATGTAPLVVASTTVVTNLNADKLDGYDAADIDYSFVSGNDAATDVTAAQLETLSDGSNADSLHVHDILQDADGDTLVQVEKGADEDIVRIDCGGTEIAKFKSGGLTVNDKDLYLGASISTETTKLEIGYGRTGDGYAHIDLVGDTTYTDYGLRIVRGNGGANATSVINHRGTGDFTIKTSEAANLSFQTNAVDRLLLDTSGKVKVKGATTGTVLVSLDGTESAGDGVEVTNKNDTNLFMHFGQHGGSSQYIRIVPRDDNGGASNYLWSNTIAFDFTNARWEHDGEVVFLDGIKVGSASHDNMDGYKEGTFTPVLYGTTVAGSNAYTTQDGSYIRIGDAVFFRIVIRLTGAVGALASTGNLRVDGLPYTASGVGWSPSVGYCSGLNMGAGDCLSALIAASTNDIYLYEGSDTGMTTLTHIEASDSLNIYLSGFYETSDSF